MAPSMSDSEAFFLQSVQFYLVARENNNGFMGGPWNKIIAIPETVLCLRRCLLRSQTLLIATCFLWQLPLYGQLRKSTVAKKIENDKAIYLIIEKYVALMGLDKIVKKKRHPLIEADQAMNRQNKNWRHCVTNFVNNLSFSMNFFICRKVPILKVRK